ncbi:major facilitator superfamily domain-containing protein 6 [Nephila pilipes]|uniref:Major facilitator superfamily domain-containing protein 6 n=1 Tax=Nephila pilipes TaxID=299642 RepID=A0A8X6URC1_NEPPI|nr:major facilitator superfamily domain-containing protein 6 [Nephila pilipes]
MTAPKPKIASLKIYPPSILHGRAFGSLLGGFLVNNYGFRQTFRFFAYGCIGCGTFYSLMYITWLRRWRKNHRTASESDRRTNSSVSEEKDEETMKNQAFSSFSLHCSFDSPSLVSYTPEYEDEFRPRALSHVPAHASNSFKTGVIPRHAVSFSEGKHQRPFTIGLSASQDSLNLKRLQRQSVNSVENNKLESVTRF